MTIEMLRNLHQGPEVPKCITNWSAIPAARKATTKLVSANLGGDGAPDESRYL